MTYDTIKAKPTWYAGIQFRSRLEARWAVFFDALGIPWEYEPETLTDVNGGTYTPDFRLPSIKVPTSSRLGEVFDPFTSEFKGNDTSRWPVYVEVKPTLAALVADGVKLTMMVEYSGPCAGGLMLLGPVPDASKGAPFHPVLTWHKGVADNLLAFTAGGGAFDWLPGDENWSGEDGLTQHTAVYSHFIDPRPSWPCDQAVRLAYSAARNERFGLYPAA